MVNTHRNYCPVVKREGMINYPKEMSGLLFPPEPGVDMRLQMYRSFLAKNKISSENEISPGELEDLGFFSSEEDQEETVFDYGPGDDPPFLEDQAPPVPPKHYGKADPNDRHKPPPPALDSPMEVICALATPGRNILRGSDWSDNLLLGFLQGDEDKQFGKLPLGTTRKTILGWGKKEACANEDWVWWFFPIPDLPWPEEKDTSDLPRMSKHFLMRYAFEVTGQLHAHSYQNLEWFWRLIGLEPYHPPNPTVTEARTVLNRSSEGFDWHKDEHSLIPVIISQCLRHLRMIGFSYEAKLTFWALCTLIDEADVGEQLLEYFAEWERITYWPIDIYWEKVVQHYIKLQGIKTEPGLEDAMLSANPVVAKHEFGDGNTEHTHLQSAIDNVNRETFYKLRRQPAADQYMLGIRRYALWWGDEEVIPFPRGGSPSDDSGARVGSKRKFPAKTTEGSSPKKRKSPGTSRTSSPKKKDPAETTRTSSPKKKDPAETTRTSSPKKKDSAKTTGTSSPKKKEPAGATRTSSPKKKEPAGATRTSSPKKKDSAKITRTGDDA
jgi:hypothetical protein